MCWKVKGISQTFKRTFPTDALDPLTDALPLVGAFGVLDEDLADGLDYFRPAGGLFGRYGTASLENMGRGLGIGDLAAHQQGHAAFLSIKHRQSRAHGVAVAAVHATLFVDHHALNALVRMRPDGAGGARGDRGGDFAQMAQLLVGHLGGVRWMPKMAMSEQCTAPHMLRQQARAILTWAGSLWLPKYSNRSSMTALTMPEASMPGCAVDPTLGVDDVAHRVTGGAKGTPIYFCRRLSGRRSCSGREQELDVFRLVNGDNLAKFISDVAQFFDKVSGYQPRRAAPDGENLVPAFATCTNTPGSRIS